MVQVQATATEAVLAEEAGEVRVLALSTCQSIFSIYIRIEPQITYGYLNSLTVPCLLNRMLAVVRSPS